MGIFLGGPDLLGANWLGGRSALSLEVKFGVAFWGGRICWGANRHSHLEVNLGGMLGGRLAGGGSALTLELNLGEAFGGLDLLGGELASIGCYPLFLIVLSNEDEL